MDYINTSPPNFIGGSKALEIARQRIKTTRVPAPISMLKVNLYSAELTVFVSPLVFVTNDLFLNLQLALTNYDIGDSEIAPNTEKSLKFRANVGRHANGIVPEQASYLLVLRCL